jgi:putative Ca2+/H+ antiporter (TMEM165/GDT1 family)
MDLKLFSTVFVTVFIAEIADKTQVATLLYASDAQHSKISVFLGSALALVSASAIAVLAGSVLADWVNSKYLSWLAGSGFIAVGIWVLFKNN